MGALLGALAGFIITVLLMVAVFAFGQIRSLKQVNTKLAKENGEYFHAVTMANSRVTDMQKTVEIVGKQPYQILMTEPVCKAIANALGPYLLDSKQGLVQ